MDKGKIYYTIGEVAEMFNVNVSTIRYWDKEFSILKLERTANKGNRLFKQKDIENFRLIYHLLKEKGMTIKGAEQYLKTKKLDSAEKDAAVIERLEGIKSMLLEVRSRLGKDNENSKIIFENTDN